MIPQINHITKKNYSNTNRESLEAAMIARKYEKNEWLTFKQAKGIKLTVKKGQHGIQLLRMVKRLNEKTKKEEFVPLHFTVFNIDQTESLEE